MPFNWRRLIPYGLGALIPNRPAAPVAPAPGQLPNPNTGYPGSGSGDGSYQGGNYGWTSSGGADPASAPYAGSGWRDSASGPAPPPAAPTVNANYNPNAPADRVSMNPFDLPFQQGPGSIWGDPTAGGAVNTGQGVQGGPGIFGRIGTSIGHAFGTGGIFGDAPGLGRINTGAAGGPFAGVAPWSAAGVAAGAAGQNPGAVGYVDTHVERVPAGTHGAAL